MSKCKIHNVRFYKPKPEGIRCMAFDGYKCRLALARADCSLEVWNIKDAPFIEKTLPHTVNNPSIEDIAWFRERLFSVGLHGLLVEYDLFALTKKSMFTVTGEAAFCLDSHDMGLIAVGTEQGYVNIFNADDDDVMFSKCLDKQEGRILCLKFDPSGSYIASGSADAIRIWDVTSGHALHRMTTGRSSTHNQETIVWCIDILNDLTVITGDSRGKLTFWDGRIGAQTETFQTHKADILALAVSDDENMLYCAGIDPNIVSYVRVSHKNDQNKWMKSIERKVHDHDVRSLILFDNKVFSGGVDGYLACSYFPPKTLLKYPPLLQNPCIVVSRKSRCVLLRYSNFMEIWALGETHGDDHNASFNGLLPIVRGPKKLLKLHRSVRDDVGTEMVEGILYSAMSNDGKWIAFSTDTAFRLFQFENNESNTPTLIPIEDLPEEVGPSVHILFTPNSTQVILAPRSGGLQVLELGTNSVMLTQNIDGHSVFQDTVTFLCVSTCNRYLVAGDSRSNVAVWIKKTYKWEKHCKLPKYHSAPTAMAIHPKTAALVVAYADQKIIEYSLESREVTKFSKNLDSMNLNKYLHKLAIIKNVTFDPKKPEVIILHDDSNIIVISKEKKVQSPDPKIPKIEQLPSDSREDDLQTRFTKHAIHAIKKYKHLVHFEWLSDSEMVAVEVSPLKLLNQLPPCLKQDLFGTK